tara:strand:- start:178 stop:642 length:465 start_codon:yes stop_codon:yes gene_type:complete
MKKGESFIYDSLTGSYNYLVENKYNVLLGIFVTYIVYLLYDLGKSPNRQPLKEGYSNEPLNPSNIKDSIRQLKKTNTYIKDELLVDKYKVDYEEYLIQLFDYINLVALEECVRPNPDIVDKMETLKEIDTRYTPLKDMVNQSMKTLDEASSKKK